MWEDYQPKSTNQWEDYRPGTYRTGKGTMESPYKITGSIDVPTEEGLEVSPVASMVIGGKTGEAVGKGLFNLLGKSPISRYYSGADKVTGKMNDVKEKLIEATLKDDVKGIAKYGDKIKSFKDPLATTRTPQVNVASKIPGVGNTIGKYADKYIGNNIDKLLSRVSDTATLRSATRIRRGLENAGYSSDAAETMIQKWLIGKDIIGKNLPNAGKATGTALGALVGGNQ